MSFFNERLKCLRGNTLSRNSFLKAKEEQTILDASFPNSPDCVIIKEIGASSYEDDL